MWIKEVRVLPEISSETRGSRRVTSAGATDSEPHQSSMVSPSRSVSVESGGGSGAVSWEGREADNFPALWQTGHLHF